MADPRNELETLYLIDGHAQIFRAYYAIRSGLTSITTGEPTNAIFAFASMLLKLLIQLRPHYLAMAVDMPGKTFRDELYADYKAQRESPPDDFAPQVERIFQLVRWFGIPLLGSVGVEADDVIATITQRTLDDQRTPDLSICILSRDKDLEQLLGDRVTLLDLHKGTTIDTHWLMENRGIRPDQVVDFLALAGDAVDNLPGVEGIGPKTASKLLQQYGSIEGIYENIQKIKGKRRENLASARNRIPLGRTLVTLKRDVEIEFDLAQARIGPIDVPAVRRMFDEMGFRRHAADLDRVIRNWPDEPPRAGTVQCPANEDGFAESLFDHLNEPAEAPHKEESAFIDTSRFSDAAVTTRAQLEQLVRDLRAAGVFSLMAETTRPDTNAPLCGLSFAWNGGAVFIPLRSPKPSQHLDEQTVLGALQPVLENPTPAKCGHNLKRDCLLLHRAGIKLRGIVFDAMIGAFLTTHRTPGLKELAQDVLGKRIVPAGELIGGPNQKARSLDQVPLDAITPHAAATADATWRLYEKLAPRLEDDKLSLLARQVEMPLVEVLAQMQTNGICLDPDILEQQRHHLETRITELRENIYEFVGESFNLDSPRQLAGALFTRLKLPVVKRTKTGASTDMEVLEKLSELEDSSDASTTVPRLILEYRQLTKLVNTYLRNLTDCRDPQTRRIHATFHQAGTATGRLSSSNPNLQNIPVRSQIGRQIRRAFVPAPNHRLISADYSQIELRILAHLSEDPALTEAFHRDMDIHTAVAAEVFLVKPKQVTAEQRASAKVINFGIVYGISAYGLARRIEGLEVDTAQKLINDYRARFKGIDRFLQQCVRQALDEGYVTTMMGRRRPITQIASGNPSTRSLGERLAINTVVQGSAADLIKLVMVNVHRLVEAEDLPLKLLLQIHDELVLEAPAARAAELGASVKLTMESAMALRVPLKVEVGIGTDWLAAK